MIKQFNKFQKIYEVHGISPVVYKFLDKIKTTINKYYGGLESALKSNVEFRIDKKYLPYPYNVYDYMDIEIKESKKKLYRGNTALTRITNKNTGELFGYSSLITICVNDYGTFLHELNHCFQDAIYIQRYKKVKSSNILQYSDKLKGYSKVEVKKDENEKEIRNVHTLLKDMYELFYYCSEEEMTSRIYQTYKYLIENKENGEIKDKLSFFNSLKWEDNYWEYKKISKKSHYNFIEELSNPENLKIVKFELPIGKNTTDEQYINYFKRLYNRCLINANKYVIRCHKLYDNLEIVSPDKTEFFKFKFEEPVKKGLLYKLKKILTFWK